MFLFMLMECIFINKEGIIFYQDKKGYEDYWCKYQKLLIVCDIWMFWLGQILCYEKQIIFIGEDCELVWVLDGKLFYYLSEENGMFNVYQCIFGLDIFK